eukprot:2613745-Alexandrium_andersonii.AAC.1
MLDVPKRRIEHGRYQAQQPRPYIKCLCRCVSKGRCSIRLMHMYCVRARSTEHALCVFTRWRTRTRLRARTLSRPRRRLSGFMSYDDAETTDRII